MQTLKSQTLQLTFIVAQVRIRCIEKGENVVVRVEGLDVDAVIRHVLRWSGLSLGFGSRPGHFSKLSFQRNYKVLFNKDSFLVNLGSCSVKIFVCNFRILDLGQGPGYFSKLSSQRNYKVFRPVKTGCVTQSGFGCFECCFRNMQQDRNDSMYYVLPSKLRRSEHGFSQQRLVKSETLAYSIKDLW